MDIDRLARRVSEQLAARPSRRGIVSAAAKLAAGAGAVLAGLGERREAAAVQLDNTCCRGDYECGDNGKCPPEMKKRYQWFCNYGSKRHLCVDCFASGSYTCTAVKK
jgi:hypothetical protein